MDLDGKQSRPWRKLYSSLPHSCNLVQRKGDSFSISCKSRSLVFLREALPMLQLGNLKSPPLTKMDLGFQVGFHRILHSARLCHRERSKILWKKPLQQARDQPEDLRSPLLQEFCMHSLDVQPEVPGRQVLAEELQHGQGKVN